MITPGLRHFSAKSNVAFSGDTKVGGVATVVEEPFVDVGQAQSPAYSLAIHLGTDIANDGELDNKA